MTREQKLGELIAPAVTMFGHELVGVQLAKNDGNDLLRVYIDNEAGITVDDCARVSEQVSGVLDVEDPIAGRYTLEVSSPGLDRPLFTAQQYERFCGHRISVALHRPFEGRRKIKGQLIAVEGDSITVLDDEDEWTIPLDRVRMARLVPEF